VFGDNYLVFKTVTAVVFGVFGREKFLFEFVNNSSQNQNLTMCSTYLVKRFISNAHLGISAENLGALDFRKWEPVQKKMVIYVD
jgi:hypothetical protein